MIKNSRPQLSYASPRAGLSSKLPSTLRAVPGAGTTADAPRHNRLKRSVYRWKDYQNWAERMRECWDPDR